MGIFSWLNSKSTPTVLEQKAAVYDSDNLYAQQVFAQLQYSHGIDIFDYKPAEAVKAAMSNPNIVKVQSKIIEPGCALPVIVYQVLSKGKLKKLEGTALNAMWEDRINEDQRSSDFMREWLSHRLNYGRTLTYMLEAPGFGITKMYNLNPGITAIIPGGFMEPIKAYRIVYARDKQKTFPAECVADVRIPNPAAEPNGSVTDILRAWSPLESLDRTIKRNNEVLTASYHLLKNGFAPGYFSPEGDNAFFDEDEQKTWRKKWRKKTGGGKNANIPATISIPLKYTSIGLKPVDMELEAANKADMLSIAGVYQVPEPLVDAASSGKWANYKEAEKTLWNNAIKPHLTAFMEMYNDTVAKKQGEIDGKTYWCEWDYSGIDALMADMEKESQRVREEYKLGIHTLRKVLEILSYPTDGIEDAVLDAYYKAPAPSLSINQNDKENGTQGAK